MASNNRQYHAERFCLALPFAHECVIRRMAEPAKKPIAAATIKEPVGCRRTTCRKPLATPLRSCSSTYNAVASSLSAVLVAQLSMISELWRPVLRTEEAAVRSAPAVSFRTSSSFLAAVLPRSSARSLASDTFAPSCDAVSIRFVICSVVLPSRTAGQNAKAAVSCQVLLGPTCWFESERPRVYRPEKTPGFASTGLWASCSRS